MKYLKVMMVVLASYLVVLKITYLFWLFLSVSSVGRQVLMLDKYYNVEHLNTNEVVVVEAQHFWLGLVKHIDMERSVVRNEMQYDTIICLLAFALIALRQFLHVLLINSKSPQDRNNSNFFILCFFMLIAILSIKLFCHNSSCKTYNKIEETFVSLHVRNGVTTNINRCLGT